MNKVLQQFLKLNKRCLPQAWLEENGPFQAVLDGANIACYQRPGFFFSQIASVLHLLSKSQPQLRPLVVRALSGLCTVHAAGANHFIAACCRHGLDCIPHRPVTCRWHRTAVSAQLRKLQLGSMHVWQLSGAQPPTLSHQVCPQVLHIGRTRSQEAKHPKAAQLLQRLRAQGLLYETPNGSNDDWYWIYASVSAGAAPLIGCCQARTTAWLGGG